MHLILDASAAMFALEPVSVSGFDDVNICCFIFENAENQGLCTQIACACASDVFTCECVCVCVCVCV